MVNIMDTLMINMDLVIAGGLVLTVLIVMIGSQLGKMPGKGLPFLLGAVVGVIGIAFFNRWKAKKLRSDIVKLEAQIDQRKQEIVQGSKEIAQADEVVKQAEKEYEQAKKEYQKNALSYQGKSRQELDNLSDDELISEFEKLL